MELSVFIPTHNPHRGRLARTLAGLRSQTLPADRWETILVDNASTPALAAGVLTDPSPANLRVVREDTLGLTAARRRGFAEARGALVVMVDDDNVLAPDYLAQVLALFAAHPPLGAAGGKSAPEFEATPEPWVREFDGLLACRDLGESEIVATQLWDAARGRNEYPPCAPIGAGMALRRAAVETWLARPGSTLTDRRGAELTSGGDNDIVLTLLAQGWHVGYFPSLALTHLIPTGRVQRDYLARLNRGIAKSWIQVLTQHAACPWGAIAPWTVPLRKAKAWFHYSAWAGPVEFIRWQGACGHFEGQASVRAKGPASP
ncbi:MAG: glycosyltransferase family 2 protein [Candidatus Didemnitutus sp.]|nr:glycosyltransferase family 2 protein [Candidatus Didemnitutus sp.]